MKKLMLNSLALIVSMILSVGCSSVKPAPKEPANATIPSAEKQPCLALNSLMRRFINGWLEGKAPPPDFTEEDKTGIASCLGAAYYASVAGLFVAQAVH
jgi:hypothetical protein